MLWLALWLQFGSCIPAQSHYKHTRHIHRGHKDKDARADERPKIRTYRGEGPKLILPLLDFLDELFAHLQQLLVSSGQGSSVNQEDVLAHNKELRPLEIH